MMPATIASTAITTSTMVMIVLAEDRPDALTELTCSSLTDARAVQPATARARSSVMTAERYYGRGMVGGGVCNSSQVNLAPALPAGAQKVPYNVLAEPVGLCMEHPPAVASCDFLDKCGQAFVIDKHKNVKR